jgi:cellulose biosynthesis protein BcsQ
MKQTELQQSLLKMYDEITTHQYKMVCFTSTSPKEGTTTIATAFAKAVAASGLKVLYCDFTDYDSSLSKLLGKSFVEGKGKLKDVLDKNIHFIESHNFYLIPPPAIDKHSIKKADLKQTLDQYKDQYDFIIIDSNYFLYQPNEILSANNLCQLADSTILIILSCGVSEEEVKEVSDKMKLKGIKLIGFVMNDLNYPKLIDEIYEASHALDAYFPTISNKLREWLTKSSILNMDI